ncbi:hypothetical protein DL96DRAFT_1681802 [Flagelloscypha sp. PMI_526]|nr:hypothetical protein DL96DRAFT_1681802 [Flagelloscypha sp. PMI_526]
MDPSQQIVVEEEDAIADRMQSTDLSQSEGLTNPSPEGRSCSLQENQKSNASSKQVRLSDLSNDLLLHIFSICDPKTISKLRQCSRGLYEFSTAKAVWLEVLKRTCAYLNLPVPSDPRSTFTSRDIELFATAWIRFQTTLRNAKDGTHPVPATVRRIRIDGSLSSLALSADGRFLFAVHSAGLQVWCLHTASPTMVSSFDMEIPGDSWSRLCANVETENSFLVYFLISAKSKSLNQCLAFRFKFSSEQQENRLELLSRLDRLLFSAQKWFSWSTIPTVPFLVTCFNHLSEGMNYILWDPIAGTCASWAADVNDTATNPIMFMVNGFLIAYDDISEAMVVYSQPEIPPKDSYAPEHCAKLNNPALVHIPAEAGFHHVLEYLSNSRTQDIES